VVERVQDLGYMVGGEEQSIWALWLLPIFSVLFVVMHHHVEGGFPQHFCGVKLSWNDTTRF
jgi:hypothetical protein